MRNFEYSGFPTKIDNLNKPAMFEHKDFIPEIIFRTMQNVPKISQKRKEFCLEHIKKNFCLISQREIARRLCLGKTTVNRWSKELGLYFRKHTVNNNFFKEWSRNMSYILGYIFTDGNINFNPTKSYYCMTITASEKDKLHLERIRNIIDSSKGLLYSPKTKSYRLIVNDKYICQDLMKLGVVPRKSLIVEFPTIPGVFLADFIRGVIDGDGNVRYCDRKRSPFFDITICSGSERFLDSLSKSVELEFGIPSKVRQIQKNLFLVQYSCKRGLQLAEIIYSDTNLFLNRKFLQYEYAIKKGGDAVKDEKQWEI